MNINVTNLYFISCFVNANFNFFFYDACLRCMNRHIEKMMVHSKHASFNLSCAKMHFNRNTHTIIHQHISADSNSMLCASYCDIVISK